MFENLRKLYAHYGGFTAMIKSSYFWVAIILTGLSHASISDAGWKSVALAIMPSLTGFTIAAFAIVFAILSPEQLRALVTVGTKGTSPILSVSSSIAHAVFIQVLALTFAASFSLADIGTPFHALESWHPCIPFTGENLIYYLSWIRHALSAFGLWVTFYGLLLVLAAVLSIFRMQLIVARAPNVKPNRSDGGE